VNVRRWLGFIEGLLVLALMIAPASAAPFYFGDTAWQAPGACGGNSFTQHLCFPYGASPARTAAEQQIVASYLARGFAASDLLFVGNRQPTIQVDIQPTGWVLLVTGSADTRFANRTDHHLHVLVDGTLSHFGMDTTKMGDGTLVIATFGDGSKAVFKLVVTATSLFTKPNRQWVWTGQAWNAEGFEIDRTGNMRYPINGPPTYEPSAGVGSGDRRMGTGRPGYAGSWFGTPTVQIEYWVQTISVSGGGSSTRTFVIVQH
jgi:hypothetical protein